MGELDQLAVFSPGHIYKNYCAILVENMFIEYLCHIYTWCVIITL